jgi:hypothetical protein
VPASEDVIVNNSSLHLAAIDALKAYPFLQRSVCDTVMLTKQLVERVLPGEMLEPYRKASHAATLDVSSGKSPDPEDPDVVKRNQQERLRSAIQNKGRSRQRKR